MDKELITYLAFLHAGYNLSIFAMFLYTASLGVRIRHARLRAENNPTLRKRHRKLGPLLGVLGSLGFVAGAGLIFMDAGHIMKYPPHFLMGLLLVILIVATFMVSRKINNKEPRWRTIHFALGIIIIITYIAQVLAGLAVLLG
jgi:uncharacterized membrane protein SirB2